MTGMGQEIVNSIDRSFLKADEFKAFQIEVSSFYDKLSSDDVDGATTEATKVLESLWTRFSLKKYTDIFVEYPKIQKALFGLELTEEGGRYRDHLIHVINVLVSGLIIFSKMIETNKVLTWKLLKLSKESDKVPFPSHYNESRRLFYLWSLMSTLHDIALPIQHARHIAEGLNKFYGQFPVEVHALQVLLPPISVQRAAKDFRLLARLHHDGVILNAQGDGPTYSLASDAEISPYFMTTLLSRFEDMEHGTMAAYFLYDSVHRTFLEGQHEHVRYDLDVVAVVSPAGQRVDLPVERQKWKDILEKIAPEPQFDDKTKVKRIYADLSQDKVYERYVLEQDITRAALAIALHDINPGHSPKLFPIKFSKLPLAWMLVLLDECQEYYRPEGLSLLEIVRFQDFPQITVNEVSGTVGPKLVITIILSLKKPREPFEQMMIKRFNAFAKEHGQAKVETYGDLVKRTWSNIWDVLRGKLSFEASEPVGIRISVSYKPENVKLDFDSSTA